MLKLKNCSQKFIGVFISLWIVLSIFSINTSAAVGINEQLNFQGKIVNTSGTNITNGTYNIEFKIYCGGDGTPGTTTSDCLHASNEQLLWTETRLRNNSQGVTITDGVFQVNLGEVTAFASSVDWNQDKLWLSINIGNTNATCTPFSSCVPDGQMDPMIRLTAVPYALNAKKVNGLTVTNTSDTSFATATTLKLPDGNTYTIASPQSGTTDTIATLTSTSTLTNKTIGSTGLTFSGATTDITTTSGEALTLTPGGTGQLVLNTSNTSASALDLNATGTVAGNAITLDTTDGGIALTAAGASNGDITLAATDDISINGTAGSLLNIGTSNVTQTISIGLATNVDLALTDPNWSITGPGVATFATLGSGAITTTGSLTFSGVTSDIITGTDESLTLAPNGSGDIVLSVDGNTNLQLAPTITSTNSIDTISLSITDQTSSGTQRGMNISLASDSTVQTTEQLLYLANLDTTGTLTDGMKIEQNASGGTLTNGLNITNTAGTLTTGISMTGTFTNYIDTPNFDVSNAGTVTIASGQAYTGSAGVTLSSGGSSALTLDSASGSIALSSDSLSGVGTNITAAAGLTIATTTSGVLTLDSGTTGAVNLGTGNNAKTVAIGTGTAGNTINMGTDNTTKDTIAIGSALDDVAITGDQWSVTNAGVLTVASCSGCGGGGSTLQQAYEAGETIDVNSTHGAMIFDLTSANFDIKSGEGSDTGDFRVWDGTDTWLFVDESADTLSLGAAAGSGVTIDAGTGTLNLGTTNNARTINIGTGTAQDIVNIGTGATTANTVAIGTGAVANTITIGSSSSTGVSITDNQWSISAGGGATFASINNMFFSTDASFPTFALNSGNGAFTINIGNTGFTLNTTDGTTVAMPSADGTLATLALAEIFTNKTIGSTGLVFSGAGTDITTTAGEALVVQSGNNGSGASGAVTLTSGTGTTSTGALAINSGNSSAGTAGNISLDVGTSNSGNGSLLIGTAARAQTITIGNSTGGATRVGQNGGTLQLDGTNFDVSTAGTVTIAAAQSYTGAGAVTLSSTTNTLTLNSGNDTLTIDSSDTALSATGLASFDVAATLGIDSTTLQLGGGSAAILETLSGNAALTLRAHGTGTVTLGQATNQTITLLTNNDAANDIVVTGGITFNDEALFSLGTTENLTIANTGLTSTSGLLDIDATTNTTGVMAANITIANDDTDGAADTLYGLVVNVDDNATTTAEDTVYGIYIDSLSNGTTDPDQVAEALLVLDNSDATAADSIDDGILFVSAGGQFGDAIDLSGITATNGINVGTNKITGSTWTLEGTTALTLGDAATGTNATTVAIFSSDWEVSSTGVLTGISIDANGTGNSITNIETGDIANGTIDADDLDQATADGAPADEECLTFEDSGGGDFEWQSCGGGTADLDTVYTNDSDKTMTVNNASGLSFNNTSSGAFAFKDGGTAILTIADVSGTAANGFTFTGAAASSGVTFAATGSDTDIGLTINSKGAGALLIDPTGAGSIALGSADVTGMTFTTDNSADTDFSFVGGTTFNDDVVITAGAGEVLELTRTLTSNTAENAATFTVTAANPGANVDQYGLYFDNAASTEAVDGLLVLNNTDADDAVGAGILFTAGGAGTDFTYGIDLDLTEIGTADIRLENGETIDNGTDGRVTVTTDQLRVSGGVPVLYLEDTNAGDWLFNGNSDQFIWQYNGGDMFVLQSGQNIIVKGNLFNNEDSMNIGTNVSAGVLNLVSATNTTGITLDASQNVSIPVGTLDVTESLSSTTADNILQIALTNSTSSGDQYIAYFDNVASSGTTDASVVIDNSDTDTVITDGLLFVSAGGGFTDFIDTPSSVFKVDGSGNITAGAVNAGSGAITTSGSISTTGSGTITSAGLLTGSAGLTVTGTTSVNTSGSSAVNIGTSSYSGTITIGNASLTALKLGKFTTANGVLYISATDGTVSETAASTGTQCLQTASAGSAPIWGSCGGGITADSLDFIDFEDTLDLDAALVLNQGSNTWTQNFTGTTTNGLTYVATSLTTGTGLLVQGGTAMTTGSDAEFNGATYIHTTAETGSLVDILFTDASTNNNVSNSVSNGLNITATLNAASGQGTKEVNGLNVSGPTLTACTTGACTFSGSKVALTANSDADITQIAYNIAMPGASSAGTVVGLNIAAMTAGAATEYGIRFNDSDWDQDIYGDAGLDIDVASGQTITIGNTNNAKTISIGLGTAIDTINIGTGATGVDVISVGTGSGGSTIHIGNNGTAGTVNIGNGSLSTKVVFADKTAAPGAESSVNGQVYFGSVGTVNTSGRIWVRSNGRNMRFNSVSNVADYSEYISQSEPSEQGDVMVIDRDRDSTVHKSRGQYEDNILGVVTNTGTSNNNGWCEDEVSCDRTNDPRWANVGMLGQVAVKVSTENGPISIGDRLTTSSIPGVAMKATRAGQVIGRALEAYNSSNPQTIHRVMTLISPSYYDPGTDESGDIEALMLEARNTTPYAAQIPFATAGQARQGSNYNRFSIQGIMNKIGKFSHAIIANLKAGAILSNEVTTDTLLADRAAVGEVSAAQTKTDGLTVNTISSATGTVAFDLGTSGQMKVIGANGTQVIRFDSSGNASFNGTLTAERITANQIDGLDVVSNNVTDLLSRVTSLENSFNDYITGSPPGPTLSPTGDLQIQGLTVQNDATLEGNLRVRGSSMFDGMIEALDTIRARNSIVENVAQFLGIVTFKGNVNFEGRPTFNNDTAGFAVIKSGSDRVKVVFEDGYETVPVINANVAFDELPPGAVKINDEQYQMSDGTIKSFNETNIELERSIFEQGISYIITRRSKTGFTIVLNKQTASDIRFSWLATAVKNPTTSSSSGNPPPTVSPTSLPTSSPTQEPTNIPTAAPTSPPTTVTPTSLPSPTEGASPTPTP